MNDCLYGKPIGMLIVSRYMMRKYGWEEAVRRTLKAKKPKYIAFKAKEK